MVKFIWEIHRTRVRYAQACFDCFEFIYIYSYYCCNSHQNLYNIVIAIWLLYYYLLFWNILYVQIPTMRFVHANVCVYITSGSKYNYNKWMYRRAFVVPILYVPYTQSRITLGDSNINRHSWCCGLDRGISKTKNKNEVNRARTK